MIRRRVGSPEQRESSDRTQSPPPYLGPHPGDYQDDEDEDDLDDPEDALEGAEVVVAAPDAPGEVPARGGPPRGCLLHTDVVAGLGDGLAGAGHCLK